MQTQVNISFFFQLRFCLHFPYNLIHLLNLIGGCRIAICFGWIGLVWETWWLLCSKWFLEFLLWVEVIKKIITFFTEHFTSTNLHFFLLIEKLCLLIVLLHDDVKRLLRTGDGGNITGITKAFSSSIVCMLPNEILKILHQLWLFLSDHELYHFISKSIGDKEDTLKSFMAFDITPYKPVFRMVVRSQILVSPKNPFLTMTLL